MNYINNYVTNSKLDLQHDGYRCPSYVSCCKSEGLDVVLLYSLVSPPLHLCLIVADVVPLLALSQVRNAAELLVVINQLVFRPNAVNGICMRKETRFRGLIYTIKAA